MTFNRHLVMLAFMMLALGLSFTAGSVGSSASCDPADCNPADCAPVCEVVSAEECLKVCPPECTVICEEACASAKAASTDCVPGCGPGSCDIGTIVSGTLAGIDPAGLLSFKLAAGQGAEIIK